MPNIGLIDDHADQRETMERMIRRALKAGGYEQWGVADTDPLADMDEYVPWLSENDVAVLVTDQKLNQHTIAATGQAVGHEGHQLIAHIRRDRPQLPIYVVTSYNDDPGLDDERDKYEFAVDRDKFNKDLNKLVAVMVRNGTHFFEQHAAQLEELSTLSTRLANGEATPEERARIGALQLAVGHDYGFSTTTVKADLLDEFEQHVNAFEALLTDLRRELERNDP